MYSVSTRFKVLVILLVVTMVASVPAHSKTEPSVRVVTGEFSPNTLVRVVGSNFGPHGPEIILFEDFEDVEVGKRIPLSSPVIGAWSSYNQSSPDPIAHDLGRSGNRSFLSWNDELQTMRQLRFTTPEKHREVFVSYWMRLAPDTYFPGFRWPNGREYRTWSDDSSFKMVWLLDDNGFRDDNLYDVIFPSHAGRGSWLVAGNSMTLERRWIGSSWWDWDGWMRFSFMVRDPSVWGREKNFETQAISEGRGHFNWTHDTVFNRVPESGHQFDGVYFPGWIRTNSGKDVAPLYDDIYVSVGPGAGARVELTDSDVYERARRIEILLAESWQDALITARVPRAVDLSGRSTWYLFVTDADGRRNSRGVAVDICPDCPRSPTVVRVD